MDWKAVGITAVVCVGILIFLGLLWVTHGWAFGLVFPVVIYFVVKDEMDAERRRQAQRDRIHGKRY